MSGRPATVDMAGRLAEALLLSDAGDQDSLDALREALDQVLSGTADDQTDVAQAVRDGIAALDEGGPDVVAHVTAAIAPILEPEAAPSSADGNEQTDPAETSRGEEPQVAAVPEAPRAAASPSLADDPELVREFIDSAREHLDDADAQLLTLEQDRADAEAIGAVFRSFHTIKGMAGFLGLQAVEDTSHDAEDTLDGVRKGELALDQVVMDSLFAAVDALRGLVSQVTVPGQGAAALPGAAVPTPQAPKKTAPKTTEVAPEVSAPEVVADAAPAQAKPAKVKVKSNGGGAKEDASRAAATLAPPAAEAAPPEQPAAAGTERPAPAAPAPRAKARGTVHVDEDRLNLLLETIGELVIAENSVSQAVASMSGAQENAVAQLSRLDKISRQLQEMATSMRMVPFRTTLRRMARLVRDLARDSGKPVQCILEGEDIELDKHVAEGITDSLVHLVRNAVDHGVEADPEERVRAGKPRTATVRISARHASGRIIIDVQDDGRGIDPEAVIARGREVGIIGHDERPSPEAVSHLLFTAGFSTRRTVTGVSGRGVGMDVVKRTAEALMGTVALISAPGEGTTVRLTLPLTLAIIDGMLVRVGDERYIIPALAIVRSQRIEPESITGVLGRSEMLATPQGLVPLIRLRELFAGDAAKTGEPVDAGEAAAAGEPVDAGDMPATDAAATGAAPAAESQANGHEDEICTIVAAADGSAYAGLVVSELLGQHQIVMKSLGTGLGDITGVSGAAILADGTVGLVIDVQQTVRIARGGKG